MENFMNNQQLSENFELAETVLKMEPARGIPQWMINLMEWNELDHFAGEAGGSYKTDPERVYLKFQKNINTCFIDQYIPTNPLSMEDQGFKSDDFQRTATTGIEKIIIDGVKIDSCEDVLFHLEKYVFPCLKKQMKKLEEDSSKVCETFLNDHKKIQDKFGADILKVPYNANFPRLEYYRYGYVNYLSAYALYPEVMEKLFKLQAEMAYIKNKEIADTIIENGIIPVIRLDHDMADSRSTLVSVKSLEEIWFPHFQYAIKPLLDKDIRLIWHCDGNLMDMLPGLIEAGISGFQGFQYEDGMDYEKICRMTDRNGYPLMIWGGVSVTKTLPLGSKEDIKNELKWLVENAPPIGFCLGASSSIAPGIKRENLEVFFEGLDYYRRNGRK